VAGKRDAVLSSGSQGLGGQRIWPLRTQGGVGRLWELNGDFSRNRPVVRGGSWHCVFKSTSRTLADSRPPVAQKMQVEHTGGLEEDLLAPVDTAGKTGVKF
jgi:hypothetical protein